MPSELKFSVQCLSRVNFLIVSDRLEKVVGNILRTCKQFLQRTCLEMGVCGKLRVCKISDIYGICNLYYILTGFRGTLNFMYSFPSWVRMLVSWKHWFCVTLCATVN